MNQIDDKIIYKELSYLVNGLLFKTHRDLGRFRKEKQYGDYLESLLKLNNITYHRECRIITQNKVRDIADFIIDNKIVVELKTTEFLTNEDYCQLQRYLEIVNIKLGILVNFRNSKLAIRRVLNTKMK